MSKRILIWGISFTASLFLILMVKFFIVDLYTDKSGGYYFVLKLSSPKETQNILYEVNERLYVGRIFATPSQTVTESEFQVFTTKNNTNDTFSVNEYILRNFTNKTIEGIPNFLNNNNWAIYKLTSEQRAKFPDYVFSFPTQEKPKGFRKNEFVLKKNEYFILNDDRTSSSDSREFGIISHKNIIGILHPFNIGL